MIRKRSIYRLQEIIPGFHQLSRSLAVTVDAVLLQPVTYIHTVVTPARISHQFIKHFIILDSFGSQSVGYQISPVGGRKCFQMTVGIEIKNTRHSRLSSHIGNHTVDPLFVVESLVIFPVHFRMPEMPVVINGQVQKQHLIIGNPGHKSTQSLVVPDMTLVAEHPALHNPYGIGVSGFYRVVYFLAVFGHKIRAFLRAFRRERYFHFVEAVGDVVVVFAEFLFPFLDEHPAYCAEKRRIR